MLLGGQVTPFSQAFISWNQLRSFYQHHPRSRQTPQSWSPSMEKLEGSWSHLSLLDLTTVPSRLTVLSRLYPRLLGKPPPTRLEDYFSRRGLGHFRSKNLSAEYFWWFSLGNELKKKRIFPLQYMSSSQKYNSLPILPGKSKPWTKNKKSSQKLKNVQGFDFPGSNG